MNTERNHDAVAIGLRLKLMRIEQGLTSIEVCERAGIQRPTLSAIEGGYYNTGIRQIAGVARALGAHVEIVKD